MRPLLRFKGDETPKFQGVDNTLGIPLLRYMFPAAIISGCGIAFALHFIRHEAPDAAGLPAITKRPKVVTRQNALQKPEFPARN
jgi:hypothetical protein